MAKELTNAIVSQKIELATELIILQVKADGWDLPEFEPGQFAVLGLPGMAPRSEQSDPEEETPDANRLIRRAYSIASLVQVARPHGILHQRGTVRRTDAKAVRPGTRRPRLAGAQGVRRVHAGQSPVYRRRRARCHGDGPRALYEHDAYPPARRPTVGDLPVLHGARQSWDLGYRSELSIMQQLCGNLTYLSLISRPANEPVPWSGMTGYVQDLWAGGCLDKAWGKHPKPEDTQVFLCGNPKMCEDMLDLLEAEGFSEHSRNDSGTGSYRAVLVTEGCRMHSVSGKDGDPINRFPRSPQWTAQSMIYDGIIIGAGHNSLILQAYLGRAGLRVLCIEARNEAGGGLTTVQDARHPGFLHNTHSFYHRALNRMPWVPRPAPGTSRRGIPRAGIERRPAVARRRGARMVDGLREDG